MSPCYVASSSVIAIGPDTLLQPVRPKLRSCLSPSPRLSDTYTPDLSLASSSRSASFSSIFTEPVGPETAAAAWRRSKSVRWEGEDAGSDLPVTNYHETWSALEYDRSPLAPPSDAERTCVLPERNSRCLRTAIDCWIAPVLQGTALTESPVDEKSSTFFPPAGLTFTTSRRIEEDEEEAEEEGDHDHEAEEDDHLREDTEWEECMERRRMMFSMMCRSSPPKEECDGEQDDRPEFEGFRSLSARLFDLLRSVGCEEQPAPAATDDLVSDVEVRTSLDLVRLTQLEPPVRDRCDSTPSLSSAESSELGEADLSPAHAALAPSLVFVSVDLTSEPRTAALPVKVEQYDVRIDSLAISAVI